MSSECIFCSPVSDPVLFENSHAFVIRDTFPASVGHSLVIPRRHVASFFELSEDEVLSCYQLLARTRGEIVDGDNTVSGFNVGINVGKDAGQSIPHCHIHLIPRRSGDVDNPQGGVRHVIPGKGHYRK